VHVLACPNHDVHLNVIAADAFREVFEGEDAYEDLEFAFAGRCFLRASLAGKESDGRDRNKEKKSNIHE
jgi:hypothetical protein